MNFFEILKWQLIYFLYTSICVYISSWVYIFFSKQKPSKKQLYLSSIIGIFWTVYSHFSGEICETALRVVPQPIPDLSHGDDPMIGMGCVIGYIIWPVFIAMCSSFLFLIAWIIKFNKIFTRKFIIFFLTSIFLIFIVNDLFILKENYKYIRKNEIRRKEWILKNPEKVQEAKLRKEIKKVRFECDYLDEEGHPYNDLIRSCMKQKLIKKGLWEKYVEKYGPKIYIYSLTWRVKD